MELISFSKYRKKAPVYKAKKGDKEALLSLIDENRLNIYRVAKGILISEEDIRDAIQNTIIKTFQSINTLKKIVGDEGIVWEVNGVRYLMYIDFGKNENVKIAESIK